MPSLPVLLQGDPGFPDPRGAPRRGPRAGLVALGGDLTPAWLVRAYRSGIFPWSVNPITWWSPDPRGVLELGALHVSRSLRRTLRLGRFQVTRDQAFREVIVGCATAPRRGSWIGPEFVEAYTELHRQGVAHSVECWRGGRLAGGVYGVAVGGLFAGESMFHRESDASKVALVHLHEHLVARGFRLFDLQMCTEITQAMGAVEIPREEYLRRLEEALQVECRFA